MASKFYIGAHEGLLDPKHYENMGAAVWLFMWCVARVTREENDVGYVLGGTPIKYERIKEEIGIPERSYNRWVVLLRNHGYIATQKTSRGLIIQVKNSKKRSAKMADENRQSGGATRQSGGTKRHTNRHTNKTSSANAEENMKKSGFKHNETQHSDHFEDVVDYETGETVEDTPKTNADKIIRDLIRWAEKRRGSKFPNVPKQRKALANARKADISPKRIKTRWEEMERDDFWGDNGFDFMDVVNTRCSSFLLLTFHSSVG